MGMGLIVYVVALVIVLLFLKWLTDWRNRKYLYLLIVVIVIAAVLWYQGILWLEWNCMSNLLKILSKNIIELSLMILIVSSQVFYFTKEVKLPFYSQILNFVNCTYSTFWENAHSTPIYQKSANFYFYLQDVILFYIFQCPIY